MRALGLVACQPRPWRRNLTEPGPAGPIPNLFARDFAADAPGTKMVRGHYLRADVGGSRVQK